MFDSDRYQVREKSFSNGDQHKIYEEGDLLYYSRIDDSEIREDLVIVDRNDNRKLKVTTNPKLDVPVSYTIIDEEKDEVVGGLRRDWGMVRHHWKLINSDNKVEAIIKEDILPLSLSRRYITSALPFKYDIVTQDGEKIADIDGKFMYRDFYNIKIQGDTDPRLIVPAAIVMDSIEKKQ